jgi:hypothetical protein
MALCAIFKKLEKPGLLQNFEVSKSGVATMSAAISRHICSSRYKGFG